MMKEIKFRAWDKRINQFIQSGVQFNNTKMCLDTIPDIELMQYTGLYDSNNREEYFGYIIEETDGTLRVIEDGCSAVLFRNPKNGAVKYFWELCTPHHIVGNIYENPELLEAR
jgi:hypothetical protein